MAYNRDQFIRLLTDYYEFCMRVFWDETTIVRPPAGGWPSITQETMGNLRKNDTVIDLLRHLPYPQCHEVIAEPVTMKDTPVVNYLAERIQKKIETGDRDYFEPYDHTPSYCAAIAMSHSRNGYWVIFNTEDGRVYWGAPQGTDEPEPKLNEIIEKGRGQPDGEWWDGFNIYEPADFFAICKKRFREMNWIATDRHHISHQAPSPAGEWEFDPELTPENEEDHDFMARVMVWLGWPGDGEGTGWDLDKFIDVLGKVQDWHPLYGGEGDKEMEDTFRQIYQMTTDSTATSHISRLNVSE